jgi:Cof subfamily protein (haloacid dehalogenase superfamily)
MAVFCSDIDGTLLNAERTLSPRTISAIRAVRDAGHTFVLCSSRPPASMRLLESLYGAMDEPLIAYNGGLVVSASGEVIRDIPIPSASARAIYALCVRLGVHGSFYAGDEWYVWAPDRWADREISNTGIQPQAEFSAAYIDSARVDIAPPHKVMCMGDAALIDEFENALATNPELVTYRSKPTYLEIANARCSKGAGVRAIAADLGVSLTEVTFFGDNVNDLSAFEVVGTAVAVANAKDEVIAAATIIAPRHRDDGVAQYLEEWLAAQ